jgi:hypothetical protein
VDRTEILVTGGTGVLGRHNVVNMIVVGLAVLLPALFHAGTYGTSRGDESVGTSETAHRRTEA